MKNLFLGKVILSAILVVAMATGVLGKTKRILLVGDSIIKGEVGSSPVGGFRDDLDNLLTNAAFDFDFVGGEVDGSGFDAEHEGHDGWRTEQVDSAMGDWISNYSPDAILLLIGTNDVSQGSPSANIISRIDGILNKIGTSITIYLSALLPRLDGKDNEAGELNQLIKALVDSKKSAGFDIFFTDPNTAFKANSNWPTDYMFDNLHPSNLGYFVMSQVYLATITFDPLADLVDSDPFDDAGVFAQDWTSDPSEFQISGGNLVNVASASAWYSAVYNKFTNPTRISMVLASSVDQSGIENLAFGLRLNSNSTMADGYFLRFKPSQNRLELWGFDQGGVVFPGPLTRITPSSPIPVANDTVSVLISSDAEGHHFDVFVNDESSGRLTDPDKV